MKKAKKAKKKVKATPAKKFGVSHLAKQLNVKPATVRIKLREGKVKKSGKGYGWDTAAEMQKVAEQLSA